MILIVGIAMIAKNVTNVVSGSRRKMLFNRTPAAITRRLARAANFPSVITAVERTTVEPFSEIVLAGSRGLGIVKGPIAERVRRNSAKRKLQSDRSVAFVYQDLKICVTTVI